MLVQVVYVGDGNNIVHSWIRLAAKFDFEFVCACPKGYEPDEATMELAREAGGKVSVSYDPMGGKQCSVFASSEALWSFGCRLSGVVLPTWQLDDSIA